MIHTDGKNGLWELNGHEYRLRSGGLGYMRLSVDGEKVMEKFDDHKNEVIAEFEQLTGFPVDQLERIYWHAHPYFDDPMGSPSMYE